MSRAAYTASRVPEVVYVAARVPEAVYAVARRAGKNAADVPGGVSIQFTSAFFSAYANIKK